MALLSFPDKAVSSMKVIAQNPVEIYCFFRAWVSFFAYAPGPDLASNADAVLPGLINDIDIAIFAEEVAPGQALNITFKISCHFKIG